jgi:hypothetical protein
MVIFGGCSAKYVAIKGNGLPNPPTERVKVYVGDFPVESFAVETVQRTGGGSTFRRAGELPKVKRDYSISDLGPFVKEALSGESIKALQTLTKVQDLENLPEVENPFVLADEENAILKFTGKATINSQKVGFEFSDDTNSLNIEVVARNMRNGINTMETSTVYTVKIPYDSDVLKDALLYSVLGLMTQKSPF